MRSFTPVNPTSISYSCNRIYNQENKNIHVCNRGQRGPQKLYNLTFWQGQKHWSNMDQTLSFDSRKFVFLSKKHGPYRYTLNITSFLEGNSWKYGISVFPTFLYLAPRKNPQRTTIRNLFRKNLPQGWYIGPFEVVIFFVSGLWEDFFSQFLLKVQDPQLWGVKKGTWRFFLIGPQRFSKNIQVVQ